ncbi:MAG: bifunctional hydroxymethylpyrimidine kinase/phosphomethylpyrimidine kinase [Betaproteobacteria bacterium]|nr:MAG: bifunctional hydroxymethylpyrimidine kinase/phosphomethylpyrimidine kinase [Betaproteobacteria bacterium]
MGRADRLRPGPGEPACLARAARASAAGDPDRRRRDRRTVTRGAGDGARFRCRVAELGRRAVRRSGADGARVLPCRAGRPRGLARRTDSDAGFRRRQHAGGRAAGPAGRRTVSSVRVRPIVWSIAGNDSGGGAGIAADLRAAGAFGVHLCPVIAALTAQNSRAVTRVEPVDPRILEDQLAALEHDMPPAAIKTGLLGSDALVQVVARWVDRLRARRAVALVVDPVQASSTGTVFADEATLSAIRSLLLPRADLVTPNRCEAAALAGIVDDPAALARALRAAGASAAAVTGGDEGGELAVDWIETEHACGWLALPRVDTAHVHGTGCTFATAAAAALALGFVAADALVLAKMATANALRQGYPAGEGAGPVAAGAGFAGDPGLLPTLSFDTEPPRWVPARPVADHRIELYAIVDSAARVRQVLAAGIRTVQLRIKHAELPALEEEIRASVAACRECGARLFVNDHWKPAAELGADGVHLGQQDLAALGGAGRRAVADSGLALGVSSHSLWELARAKALCPDYIACGPVWPTTAKAMPWRTQGLDNLSWWCAAAGAPVVAIGGILTAHQVRAAASCGAQLVCVLRGLGDTPVSTVPFLLDALHAGSTDTPVAPPALPHPTIAPPPRSGTTNRAAA